MRSKKSKKKFIKNSRILNICIEHNCPEDQKDSNLMLS